MPSLLTAAGLHCDVVSVAPSFRLSRHLRRLVQVDAASALAPAALACWEQEGPYQWVISMTDSLLGELAQRSLLDGRYRHLLPLKAQASPAHLHSKIGLSRAFSAAGIPTPPWRVARDPATARQQVAALGWPVLLKQDASAGGKGVWRCNQPEELAQAAAAQVARPFLLQQWVEGRLYSVEALYRHGHLLAFALSVMEEFIRPYGPSRQRCYGLPADQIPQLDSHLERIGHVLGLHGFANISLIVGSGDDLPQFFECDARPNAWIQLDLALGGDFARALRAEPGRLGQRCYAQLPCQSLALHHRRPSVGGSKSGMASLSLPDEDPAFLKIVRGV